MENIDSATTTDVDRINLVETLTRSLVELEDNSKNFMLLVEQLRSNNHIDELASELFKLQKNVQNTLDPFWQQIKDEMFDAKCYIKEKEEELKKLKINFKDQEKAFMNIRHQLRDVKTALFHQSSYTTSLGATLCSLLWKASRDQFIVVELLKGRKLLEFLQMVSDSIRSFFDAFGEELPSVQSKEGQFILSIVGVIANVAAVSEGRKFLFSCIEGEHVIREFLRTVPNISPSGIYIQRMILMALYNVSLDKRENSAIENDKIFLSMLVKNISQRKGELRSISLRLLQSLTFDVKNLNFLVALINAIKSVRLEEIQQYCTEDEKSMITQIIDNVESARLHLQNGENKLQNGF